MIETSRRKFFGLAAAVPVVATAAATKMGLVSGTSNLGTGAMSASSTLSGGHPGLPPSGSFADYLRRQIKEFWSPDAKRQREAEAAQHARMLDPDLASMRSLTPSAAYHIQRGRVVKRIEDERLASLNAQLASALKETFQ